MIMFWDTGWFELLEDTVRCAQWSSGFGDRYEKWSGAGLHKSWLFWAYIKSIWQLPTAVKPRTPPLFIFLVFIYSWSHLYSRKGCSLAIPSSKLILYHRENDPAKGKARFKMRQITKWPTLHPQAKSACTNRTRIAGNWIRDAHLC